MVLSLMHFPLPVCGKILSEYPVNGFSSWSTATHFANLISYDLTKVNKATRVTNIVSGSAPLYSRSATKTSPNSRRSVCAGRCRTVGVTMAPTKAAAGFVFARSVTIAKRKICPHISRIRVAVLAAPLASPLCSIASSSRCVTAAIGRFPIAGNTSLCQYRRVSLIVLSAHRLRWASCRSKATASKL